MTILFHDFVRGPEPVFFATSRREPCSQPQKSAARSLIIALRKHNHSVYEISRALKEQNCPLSPTAVGEVLKPEGFAALPRRLDQERSKQPGPATEAIADVRGFFLGRRMGSYGDAHARPIFRDLLDLPAQIQIMQKQVRVEFHRRTHLLIILSSALCDRTARIPWWSDRRLRLTPYTGR